MTKKIGFFSDIHGSWNNLEAIVNSFNKLNIDAAAFLGDALYETQSKLTSQETQKLLKFKGELMQKSSLRSSILKGNYSDVQLERIANSLTTKTALSKGVAKAEYTRMKSIIKDLPCSILGGNWDYQKEMQEVFGDSFLNAKTTDLAGVKTGTMSGGGSALNLNIPDETFADNPNEEEYFFKSWDDYLLQEKEADIYISHIQPTDGEGIKKETAVEHYKGILEQKIKSGIKNPDVLIHGHKHGSGSVEYSTELQAFIVSPGVASSNHHNNYAPTFMVGEFDDDNKLQKVLKYEIRSSLNGIRNVVQTQEFELDYEAKKVKDKVKIKTFDEPEIILQESDVDSVKSNLALDENYDLIKKGFNTNYTGLSTEEKDQLLRKNISVMFEKTEEIEGILKYTIKRTIEDSDKLDRGTIDQISFNLSEKALKMYGASLDHLPEEDQEILRNVFLEAAFKINSGELHNSLGKKIPKNKSASSSWANGLIKSCSENLSTIYQQHIFDFKRENNLTGKDYQEMAEMYMPQGYERTDDLAEGDAFQLWVKSYHEPLISDADMKGVSEAYKKNKNFTKNKKTKQEIADMFGFDVHKPVRRFTTDALQDTEKESIYEGITNNEIPVLKDADGKEYLQMGKQQIPVGKDLRNHVNYTAKTQEQYHQDLIRSGNVPVIEREGQHYVPTPEGRLVPISEFNMDPSEYVPIAEEEFRQKMQLNSPRVNRPNSVRTINPASRIVENKPNF